MSYTIISKSTSYLWHNLILTKHQVAHHFNIIIVDIIITQLVTRQMPTQSQWSNESQARLSHYYVIITSWFDSNDTNVTPGTKFVPTVSASHFLTVPTLLLG
jgi:hypothetical protein